MLFTATHTGYIIHKPLITKELIYTVIKQSRWGAAVASKVISMFILHTDPP